MLNSWFQRTSFVVVLFLLLQTSLPFWVSANTNNDSNIANSENIIIICSGNKLEYLVRNKNGDYTKIKTPEGAPGPLQIIHCDACIFPFSAFLQIDSSLHYLLSLDAHKRSALSGKLPLDLHKYRPPLRAPPAS